MKLENSSCNVCQLVVDVSAAAREHTATTSSLLPSMRSRSRLSSASFFRRLVSSRRRATSFSASSRPICARRSSAACLLVRSALSASRSRTLRCSNRITKACRSLLLSMLSCGGVREGSKQVNKKPATAGAGLKCTRGKISATARLTFPSLYLALASIDGLCRTDMVWQSMVLLNLRESAFLGCQISKSGHSSIHPACV